MQLASKGIGLLPGLKGGGRSTLSNGVRGLHVHAPIHASVRPTAPSPQTTASRLFTTARNALTRFAAHLATPGFTHPVASPAYARYLSGLSTRVNASVRPPPISSGFALGTRNAFAHRPGRPFVRAGAPMKPGVYDVGLGTARNFGTARPLVQTFVNNVPVAARSLCEVDLDVEKMKMKNRGQIRHEKKAESENSQPHNFPKKMSEMPKLAESNKVEEEIDDYFTKPIAATSSVSTILLVPLAPTPTSRVPLSSASASARSSSTSSPHLLPLSDLQSILSSHKTHSTRVASLFKRLDAARVWERGATFSAHGDASGLCTVLRVAFDGWPEWAVRDVIGEAGKGWCRLVETADGYGCGEELGSEVESLASLDSFSISTSTSSPFSSRTSSLEVDPAASMVLPTLDFSASFLRASAASTRTDTSLSLPPSPPSSYPSSPALSISDFEAAESEFESEYEPAMSCIEYDSADPPASVTTDSDWSNIDASSTWSLRTLSFSSEFLQRVQAPQASNF